MNTTNCPPVIFLMLVLGLPLNAATNLGEINFPTSCTAKAQKNFLEGVLWLHSFAYDEALTAFQKAQQADPNCAMAYWGEAMAYNHPVWNEQDYGAAVSALARLAPTREERLAKAHTEKEKQYLSAVETLYGKGSKKDRDLDYAAAMRQLWQQYPEDLEAAAFYGLALLGECEGVRDIPTYMKAAAVLEDVFMKNGKHPGALHYLIHSYDDPVHAPLGMRAAQVYARVAPAAPHALHMPAHIFLPLGMWEEAAKANEASWNAAGRRNFHALYWLEYIYLQQGRYPEARELLKFMEKDAARSGSAHARMHLALMRAYYLVETRGLGKDAASIPVDISGLDTSIVAADRFAVGLRSLIAGNASPAKAALMDMRAYRAMQRKGQHLEDSPAQIRSAEIMEKELESLILFREGKRNEAFDLIKQAPAEEDDMSYEFGPPVPVKPSHELFGEMLIEAGRPAEAREQFKLSLAHNPRRALSTLGLARAAAALGDKEEARKAYADLQEIWRHASPDLPEMSEVHQALSIKL